MPLYLDTRGNTTLGIGICGRCSRKFPLHELHEDKNVPGLRVCREDQDVLDPYRLPARQADQITLPFVRPDESVALTYSGAVPVPLYTNPLFHIDRVGPARPWQANTLYNVGDSITPLNVDLDTTPLPQNWWLCLLRGWSGSSPPVWPTEPGVILGDYIALTSDPQEAVRILDDLGLIRLQNEAQTKDLTDDSPSDPNATVFQLLSDNGFRIFAEGNGDGNITWLNLGIYPL